MPFGLIAFAIYYIYQKDNVTIENQVNTVTETQTTEITNIRLGVSNLDTLNPLVSKNQNIQDALMLIYEPLLNITEDFNIENRTCY